MYDSDLSDEEWGLIAHHFKPRDTRGRKPTHDKKDLVNAILYINKTGTQWRMLPHEYPHWKTVYDHYHRWNQHGIWEKALDALNQVHRKKRINRLRPAMQSLIHKA